MDHGQTNKMLWDSATAKEVGSTVRTIPIAWGWRRGHRKSHIEGLTQAGFQRVEQLSSGRMEGQQHFWQSGTACAEMHRHEKSAGLWEDSVVG